MGYPSLSTLQANPFFINAIEQGVVQYPEFAFKLASEGSSLTLGGVDKSLFTGSFEYHSVNTSTGYWQIGPASIQVGSTAVLSGFQTTIDRYNTVIIVLKENSLPIVIIVIFKWKSTYVCQSFDG